MKNDKPFTCSKCGHENNEFPMVCPECGQRFVRDYIDTQMHPRDPDLTGICTSRFWIRVMLVLAVGGLLLYLLNEFGLLR